MWGIEWWFCCLHPRERAVLRQTALAMPATLYFGVPVDIFNAFCLGAGLTSAAMRAAFLPIYQLEIATIVPELPEEPFDVVRPLDLPLWVEWTLYVLSPESTCPSGCEQSIVNPP